MKDAQTKIIAHNPSGDIKTEVRTPPEHQAPLHAAAGLAAIVGFVGLGVLIATGFTVRKAVFAMYAVLGAAVMPVALYAAIQLRRIITNDHHYRAAIHAMEARWRMDIDGDGIIGAPRLQPPSEKSEYERTLMYWILSGNTKRDDTIDAMGIDPKQWQEFRDRALRLQDANGNPVFIKASRQGKGYGLIVSARYRGRWPEVEQIVKEQ